MLGHTLFKILNTTRFMILTQYCLFIAVVLQDYKIKNNIYTYVLQRHF